MLIIEYKSSNISKIISKKRNSPWKIQKYFAKFYNSSNRLKIVGGEHKILATKYINSKQLLKHFLYKKKVNT